MIGKIGAIAAVKTATKTTRGYRVGIVAADDELARLAALAPRLVRFTIRPTTLDDVYFALTEAADPRPSAGELVGDPA